MENDSNIEFFNDRKIVLSDAKVEKFFKAYFFLVIMAALPLPGISVWALFLIMPLTLIGLLILRSRIKSLSGVKKGLFIGSFIGFLVVFYDYDFFLNVGGPNTYICDQVNGILGISTYGMFSFMGCFDFFVVPLALLGLIVSLIFGNLKKN